MSDTELCVTCRKPLVDSPSDFFCTSVCQQTWQARQATPINQPNRLVLVGYEGYSFR